MLKPILALAFAFSSVLCQAQAAEPGPEAKKALHTIVKVQRIEETWRSHLDNAAQRNANIMQNTVREKVNAAPQLSPAQRKQTLALLPAWTAAVAEDLKTLDKSMNMTAVLDEMAQTVYPRYLSDREITELAAFYSSNAYRKTRDAGAQTKDAVLHIGVSDPAAWDKHRQLFTQQENDALAAHAQSDLGKKLARVAPALNKDVLAFIAPKTIASIGLIAERQMAVFVAKMNAISAK